MREPLADGIGSFGSGEEPKFPLLQVYTFGEFVMQWRVPSAGDEDAWKSRTSARSLFLLLLCAPNRQATRSQLTGILWPETDEAKARESLRSASKVLRRVVWTASHEGLLATRHNGDILKLADQARLWVDVDAFETLVQQASRETEPQQALALWQQARQLVRGEFLADDLTREWVDSRWVKVRRQAVRAARRRMVRCLADLYVQRGQHTLAEEILHEHLIQFPTDQDALFRLMHLLVEQACIDEALSSYEQCKYALAALGKQPADHIKELVGSLRGKTHQVEGYAAHAMSRPLTPEHNKQHEVIPSLPSFTQSTIAPDRKLRGPGISSNTISETLSSFENLTGICWKLSQGNDLETAERVLWAYLPKIVSLALPPSPQQPTAAKIVSQSYLLAASLAGHHNDLKARQTFSEQALLFGNVAQDRNLQIAALRQLAATFDFLGRHDKVLQTYQQALPYLSEASPLLHALIYAGISGTYAQLEWRQEAVRYLGMAYETFPAKPEDDPYFLYANGGYSTLIFCDGLNHLDFHQPQEAEKIFAQIDGLGPKMHVSEKVRISLLNCQATMFIELNDMEQACLYLEEAVKASLILGSKKLYHESLEIFAQMKGRWEGEKRVKSLGGLFQA